MDTPMRNFVLGSFCSMAPRRRGRQMAQCGHGARCNLAQKNAAGAISFRLRGPSGSRRGLRWLEEASQNGVREADGVIGSIYLEGQVRPRDFGQRASDCSSPPMRASPPRSFVWGTCCFAGSVSHPTLRLLRIGMSERLRKGTESRSSNRDDTHDRSRPTARQRWSRRLLRNGGASRRPPRAVPRRGDAAYRRGLPRNLVRAESYFRRAAKKNDLHSILALAELYSRGAHVEPDLREAYIWYRRAAELGDARAQFIAGRLSATGAGVAANLRESARWFLRSAKKGDPLAAHNVACLYARGEGVERDVAAAAKWFTIAAENGVAASQVALAHCSVTRRRHCA